MNVKDITPEEFAAMLDRNESFVGTRADISKLALYREIKADLTEFLQRCDDAVKLSEFAPNPRERNAVLYLDIMPVANFDKEEVLALTDIMRKADRVMVSGGERGIRYSFAVEKVWIE